MKIKLTGHPYYYEVVQEAKQFFLLEPFEQVTDIDGDGDFIESELRPAKKRAGKIRRLVVTRVRLDGKVYETKLLYEALLPQGSLLGSEESVGRNVSGGQLNPEVERDFSSYEEGNYADLSRGAANDYTTGIPAGDAVSRLRSAMKRSLYLTLLKATKKKLPWGSLCGVRPAKRALNLLQEGRDDRFILKEFRDFYVSKEKARLALEVGHAEQEMLYRISEKSISLYIAIPFCPSRCLYCSFFSSQIPEDEAPVWAYLEALFIEMEAISDLLLTLDLKISTVYIGGGTPTSLSQEQLRVLLEKIEKTFVIPDIIEYTVECGRPDTLTASKLALMKQYGVTRISINPQSMHETTLKLLGRNHTPEEIHESFALALKAGFQDINCDVIAAIPSESQEMFDQTLGEIIQLGPSNITVHTLSVKRSSLLFERISDYVLPTAQEVGSILNNARQRLKEHGYLPYYLYRQKNMVGSFENVGYQKSGHGCYYNVLMMEELQTIIGIGAGSVTKKVMDNGQKIERVFNLKEPREYVSRVREMILRKNELFLHEI